MNVAQLRDRVEDHPFSLNAHKDLIAVLRVDKSTAFSELFNARLNKLQYFSLSQDEVTDILEDLMAIEDIQQRRALTDTFYAKVLQEFPTVYYWLQYLEFVAEFKTKDDLQDIIITALNDTVYDFDGSHKIWDKVLPFFEGIYEDTKDAEDLDRLLKLYLKRIRVPHKHLQQSFNDTSSFVSKYFPDDYNEYMKMMSKIYSKSSRSMIYYEKHELHLSQRFEDPNFWSEYMADVGRYATDMRQVSCIFHRSLLASDEGWISVWISYIYQLYSKENTNSLLLEVLPRFVKTFPQSSMSYAELIRNMTLFEDKEYFSYSIKRIEYLDLMHNNTYDDWKVLALAILTYDRSYIGPFFSFALQNNDVYNSVEKLCIAIYERDGRIDEADGLLQTMLETFPEKCDLWVFAVNLYKSHNMGYDKINSLFKWGTSNAASMDFPDRFLQEQLSYEQVYGTLASQRQALLKANDIMKEVLETRLKEVEEESVQPEVSKKRRLEEYDEQTEKKPRNEVDPPRNREENSVKVGNLVSDTTEGELRKFFSDCGDINSVKLYSDDNGKLEAVLEFGTKQSVLAALTKSHKDLKNSKITVKRVLNAIVWVTNFPPNMTETSLEEFFSQTGKVISVRLPMQKSNKVRRFCYVEYSESESATAAVSQLNGSVLRDENQREYKLVVKVSDSHAKKSVPVVKREVYISNIDFKVTKEQIQEFFIQCGDIESVVLPIKDEMKKKGNANGGFGFVVFQSEISVERALKLNGTEFQGRPMNVRTSNKARPQVDNIDSFDSRKSIVLSGFDPKATKDQIDAFIKQKVNIPYTKLLYLPERQSVALQFQTIDDSGKASLALDAVKFNDTTLNVGTIADLKIQKPPAKPATKPHLFVPVAVQRRK